MALIPDNPQDQRRFLGILMLVLLAGAYYMYVYSPRQAEIVEMEDRIAELEHQNELARAQTGNVERLREDLEESERLYRALMELVPERAEIPGIYEEIATESQTLGLELLSVLPFQPEAPEEETYYLQQNWDLSVRGNYHSVARLLTRVASFPRVVQPELDEIRPMTVGDRDVVAASFRLRTYVIPPEAGGEDDES